MTFHRKNKVSNFYFMVPNGSVSWCFNTLHMKIFKVFETAQRKSWRGPQEIMKTKLIGNHNKMYCILCLFAFEISIRLVT